MHPRQYEGMMFNDSDTDPRTTFFDVMDPGYSHLSILAVLAVFLAIDLHCMCALVSRVVLLLCNVSRVWHTPPGAWK